MMKQGHPGALSGSTFNWRGAMAALAATMAVDASAADTPPFSPTPVNAFSADATRGKDLKRLKISVASEDGPDRQVRVGAVVACSKTQCFRAETSGFVDLVTTEAGKSSVLVEAAVPAGEIDSLFFEPTAGAKTLTGSLVLNPAVIVEEDFKGAEILVTVTKQSAKRAVEYRPVDFGTVPFDPDWQVVFYDPKFSTSVAMNFGGELSLPALATSHPMIFGVLSRDIHQIYPIIDVFPEVRLLKPASMTIKEIPRSSEEAAEIRRFVSPIQPRGAPDASRFTDSNGVIRIPVQKLGHIVPGAKSASVRPMAGTHAANATADCAATLASPGIQQLITSTLQQKPVIVLPQCTDIAPNVWIGIANLANPHNNYQVKVDRAARSPELSLQPISWFQPLSSGNLAINGFMWAGDAGNAPKQTGLALGYLYSNKVKLANNRAGGGVIPGASSGNKLVLGNKGGNLGFAFYELSDVDAAFRGYATNVVSSSTSVVKWGTCSTDTLESRWSAIGVNLNDPSGQPRLVMLSSTTDGTTTAAAMCKVFQALHIVDAIRLDGGPSVAFSVNGRPQNPLKGLYYLKYGNYRRIAYALTL